MATTRDHLRDAYNLGWNDGEIDQQGNAHLFLSGEPGRAAYWDGFYDHQVSRRLGKKGISYPIMDQKYWEESC